MTPSPLPKAGDAADTKAFRTALSNFATGVAIVTARAPDGEPVGLTMSSFNSVSLDPPLVLFSVGLNARSLPAMIDASGYAVNILGRSQEGLARSFARSEGDKWAEVEHDPGHAEAPLLHGAVAHFECVPFARHDGGDHVIFIGRVVRFSTPGEREAPLLFFRGQFRGVDAIEGEERA